MLALLLWGFAIYGLIMAVMRIVSGIRVENGEKAVRQVVVLIVENSEGYVEGMLRALLSGASFYKGEVRLLVIDTGSTDATGKIIRKFAEQEEMIEFQEGMTDADIAEGLRALRACPQQVMMVVDLRRWDQPRRAIPFLLRALNGRSLPF
jgi:hypothetical protein